MTERSAEPATPPASTGRGDPIGRLVARAQSLARRVQRIPRVRAAQSILDTYNAAGGGLTSSGLAYSALFAVIPGLLLVVSLLVIVIDNRTKREEVIAWLIHQVPPLADFAQQIVENLADSARVGTVIGLVGFIWGASGFYLGLEGAMERLFPGPRRRDPIMGRVRGVLAVALVVGTILATFVVSTFVSFLPPEVMTWAGDLAGIGSPLIAVTVSALVALVVYVIVPSDTPGWRAAFPPALAAGIGIGLLTSLYTYVAPYLVGGFNALGTIAYVFGALIWFNWVFQMLLYGAAWARLRRDRRQARGIVR
jgi:YihY family inner membrane protein